MIIHEDVPIYSICWLSHAKGGMIGTFYEPETKQELVDLCRSLFISGQKFDIIGHTSNTYFMLDYHVDVMVSTRKVNSVKIEDDCIVCDCGVSVRKLSRQMVDDGVKGFEGLIDLPGTVAASVYGNCSCYGCSINSMLAEVELLCPDGRIVTKSADEMKFSRRSSALKRGEWGGVILSVKLRKRIGNAIDLKALAAKNHQLRLETQPGPKDNLGSIFKGPHKRTKFCIAVTIIAKLYESILKLCINNREVVKEKKKCLFFKMVGAEDLLPYVYSWNRYIWKDELSHTLFWKYVKTYRRLYSRSDFEIEIKGDRKNEEFVKMYSPERGSKRHKGINIFIPVLVGLCLLV